jgi:hypothetical protein
VAGVSCEELEALEDLDPQSAAAVRSIVSRWLRGYGYGEADLDTMVSSMVGDLAGPLLQLLKRPLREAARSLARCEDMGVEVPAHVKSLVAEFSEDVYRKLSKLRGMHDAVASVRWEVVEGPGGSIYGRVHLETLSGSFTFSGSAEDLEAVARVVGELASMVRRRGARLAP